MKKIKTKNQWSKIILTIIFVASVVISFVYADPITIRQVIIDSGRYGEIVYLLMWLILPTGFFPVAVLAAAGGIGFGLVKGAVLIFIGASMNLLVMFYLARYLARDTVRNYIIRKFPKLQETLFENEKGLAFTLFLLRLSPIFPFGPINYAYGLTDINALTYYWISLLGILPGIIVYVNVGDKAMDLKSPEFLFALSLLVVLAVITEVINRIVKKREAKKNKKD